MSLLIIKISNISQYFPVIHHLLKCEVFVCSAFFFLHLPLSKNKSVALFWIWTDGGGVVITTMSVDQRRRRSYVVFLALWLLNLTVDALQRVAG